MIAQTKEFPASTKLRSQAPKRRKARREPTDVADEELWLPTRLDATIPLSHAHWLRTHFPDDHDAEAFVSMAIVSAVGEARRGGVR